MKSSFTVSVLESTHRGKANDMVVRKKKKVITGPTFYDILELLCT